MTIRACATRIGPFLVHMGENMKIMPKILKKLHFYVIIKITFMKRWYLL